MNILKRIFVIFAGLGFAITVPAQQLPPLSVDPSIETGKLGCGASYYIVKAPVKKGCASVTLVQKGDSLTAEKRASLSSAFLARMGVGPTEKGFLSEKEGSTIYSFRDIPFYRKDVLDSMLLYTFSLMSGSSAPQAVIVSGDVEPVEELRKKMDIFSLLVRKLDAPARVPAYEWNPAQPASFDFSTGPGTIAVTYAGNRVPDVFMNTAQALVTDIFGLEFEVLLRNRLQKDFAREGVTCGGITFHSMRSCDYLGDERYTVKARIAPGQEDKALRVMARTLASIDGGGVGVQEFLDAKEVLRPGLLRDAAATSDKTDECTANFLFGANLAPASERVRYFARKNIAPETETRLFGNFASALLAGENNLALELTARDTLDPAEAFMVYNANYKNGHVAPFEADYTWHGADTSGLEFSPQRQRIQKEKTESVSGGTVWTFSNGIKVVFKEIKGSGMFSYALVLGGGLSQIPDLREGEGGHIGPMLELYDVGGIPAPVFRDILEVNGLSMKADVSLNSLVVSGSAPSGKFSFFLKTLLALCNERVPNREEFRRYCAADSLRSPLALDNIYGQLYPGFRYTARPGAISLDTQDKAEAFYSGRFARMNDGVLIISGDLETGVVKRMLSRYLGGFCVQSGTTPRHTVEFKPRTGPVTVFGQDGPRGIQVVMSAPMAVTSDNFYLSLAAANAMKLALVRELTPYGYSADVSVSPMTQPQERFQMEISCFPVPAYAMPSDVDVPDVTKALTVVRTVIAQAGKRQPSPADVSAWKNALAQNVKVTLSTPEGFTRANEVRYALNKDINSRYSESIQAITPDKIRGFIATLSSGGTVEYVVE